MASIRRETFYASEAHRTHLTRAICDQRSLVFVRINNLPLGGMILLEMGNSDVVDDIIANGALVQIVEDITITGMC